MEEAEGSTYDVVVLLDPTSPAREPAGITRRQQLGRFLRVNGNFYVWRAEFVRRMETSWMDEGVHGMVEIPESRAFAIDYQYEFDVLEAMLTRGLVTVPWLRPGA